MRANSSDPSGRPIVRSPKHASDRPRLRSYLLCNNETGAQSSRAPGQPWRNGAGVRRWGHLPHPRRPGLGLIHANSAHGDADNFSLDPGVDGMNGAGLALQARLTQPRLKVFFYLRIHEGNSPERGPTRRGSDAAAETLSDAAAGGGTKQAASAVNIGRDQPRSVPMMPRYPSCLADLLSAEIPTETLPCSIDVCPPPRLWLCSTSGNGGDQLQEITSATRVGAWSWPASPAT